MKSSIKKNFFYNAFYQILLIIVPLIVTPYISRVLLPDGVGKYSFAFSLITYFTLFAGLGYSTYSQREIAKLQDDKLMQSITFWEILICRTLSVAVALATNIILCLTKVYGDYSTLMLIFNINIFAVLFDIAFFFQGNEKFKDIVLLNSIIRIASVVCIFLLVKSQNDLWIYTLINACMVLAGFLVLWIKLPKLLVSVKGNKLKPFRHLKGTLILFLPTVAITIYTVLDRTLIGLLVPGEVIIGEEIKKISDMENGFYEQSEKIVKMALTIITAFGAVMIPRNSKEFEDGNFDKLKENIYLSSRVVWLIGAPMMLGLIAISKMLVPWFYGAGYEKCEYLICIFSCLVLFIGFSNIFGLQYLIPTGQEKKYTIALVTGAFVNLVFNLIFIKLWWSIGAAIASCIAELVVTIVMGVYISKDISITKMFKISWKYILSAIIMFIPLMIIRMFVPQTMLYTFLVIMLGCVIYFIMLLILKEEIIYGFLSRFKKKNA